MAGLFAGFEGYRTATTQELEHAVQNWLVVLDTNVLLNLYSYQGRSLDEFTDVFRALGDRLFIPHQVMDEFWRNRRRVLSENQGRHREREVVEKSFDEIDGAFRRWHQRVVDRTMAPPGEAVRELAEARAALLEYMDAKNAEADAAGPDTPTHEDRVLKLLQSILEGRVGDGPDPQQRERLTKQGVERIKAKIPPGYMDGEKNPERSIGDFLVWRQAIDAATTRKMPILLVTQDQKEDWWADRGTASMRARPELVSELLAESGQPLLMIRSHDLVKHGRLLGVQISQSTVAEVEQAADEGDGGWSAGLADDYLESLQAWPSYRNVLVEAVRNGGEIARGRMAELIDRAPDASMKGTGKPFYTAAKRVVELHGLDYDLPAPLYASYESGGLMTSFVMPDNLVSLFQAAVSRVETHD